MKTKANKSQRTYLKLLAKLRTQYSVGQRFLSIREMADQEQVSIQTAFNLMKRLQDDGLLVQRPHGLSFVKAIPAHIPPYRIGVLVPEKPLWFRACAVDGLKEGFAERIAPENLVLHDTDEISTVNDAELLSGQGYDGIIGMSRDYGWQFYALHLMGQIVLADIISPSWPSMPVTCVDFRSTAERAGSLLRQYGHKRACILGLGHAGSNPQSFRQGFKGENISLVENTNTSEGVELFRTTVHNEKPTALYIAEKNCVPIALSVLATEGLRIPDDISIVIHDCDPGQYEGFAVPPITSVGPSVETIGKRLAERMSRMLERKAAKDPVVQRIPASVKVTGSISQRTS
jgi:DNA-binding LacI/PurR family transcriptional regulator